MHKTLLKGILIIFLLGSAGGFPKAAASSVTGWQAKIDPWVSLTASLGETDFILMLAEQADLSGAAELASKQEKGDFVYSRLVETAARTQPPLLALLNAAGVAHQPYWIANMIWVRGDLELVRSLARRDDIARVYANPRVPLHLPRTQAQPVINESSGNIEWNIRQVGAPQVWSAGYTGQGVVVGGQDTGAEWDHPALKSHYLGWNGTAADHNYAWHDAIHEDRGGPCGADAPEPCDDNGHGTHTIGTILGEDPNQQNRIGMAPGARWLGCRNMDQGVGTPATYSECFQWFLAPTDLAGNQPDPSRAPDVINNSWGCSLEEGCTDPGVLQSVVEAVHAAGILVVAAAGNSGPGCSTISMPPAIYEGAFSVGSTNGFDQVSGFSSRGPVAIDGSGRLKPDVSAPGEGIRSSSLHGKYAELSGTSTAVPHAAGLAALLISIEPELRGNVDELEDLIERSARPIAVEEDCGGVAGSAVPNNSAGWGRIDALAAYLELRASFRVNLPAVRNNR